MVLQLCKISSRKIIFRIVNVLQNVMLCVPIFISVYGCQLRTASKKVFD